MMVPAPLLARGGLSVRVAALLGTLAALLLVLLTFVRPWYTTWGASADELWAPLPGGVPSAIPSETRAIDIAAPPEQVFAWVAQLGQDRAGFYSYELLEDLAGCEMPNVQRLDPSLQHWSAGDELWMYPPSKLGGMGHAKLLYYQAGHALVFGTRSPTDPPDGAPTGTWSFIVEPTSTGASRLLTRAGGSSAPSLLGKAFNRAVFEPLHFAMERRMLEGIKGLAEGRPISAARDHLLLSSWVASFVTFLVSGALVLIGSRWQRRLLAFAASGVVFQLLTLRQPPPIVSLALVALLLGLVWPPRLRARAESTELMEQAS